MIHDISQLLINVLPKINEKYPNINYGGCGVFAYYLGQSLRSKYGLAVEYIYIKSITPPGGKPDYDIWFSHILLKIGDVLIDNNGLYSINSCRNDEIAQLPENKLEEMINIKAIWNNIYNHKKTPELIKYIKSMI